MESLGTREEVESHIRTQRKRVLLGLSNKQLRASISRLMSARGYDVVAVPDGFHLTQKLADAILGSEDARPSLIIINPILRGCTGLSLLSGLRELGWDTPVVFVIAKNDFAGRTQAWADGVSGVFLEPVDLRELSAFVDLAVDPAIGGAFRTLRSPKTRGLDDFELAEGTNPGVMT